MENCEEYQEGVYDEGNDVGERGEGECHPLSASMVSETVNSFLILYVKVSRENTQFSVGADESSLVP